MNKTITNIIYSYFDNKEDKRLQSSTGIDIEGKVTPSRIRAAVIDKWNKTKYTTGDFNSIEIEHEEIVK